MFDLGGGTFDVSILRLSKGAKVEVWNTKNKQGWTPLWIALGNRFGNVKPSPETEAALKKIMTAAGVSTSTEGLSNCDTHSLSEFKPVAIIDRVHHRFQFMESIGAFAEDVQQQVDFAGGIFME